MDESKTIMVFGREDTQDRALFDRLQNLIYGRGEVQVVDLKNRLNDFLKAMQDVIHGMPEKLGEFELDSITLTAEISAKGQVSLLGTGGEVASKGGLTFTLKKPIRTS